MISILEAMIIIPSYGLFVFAVLSFFVLGGITFPGFIIMFLVGLFLWAFWELGVYLDELINNTESTLNSSLEDILIWIDIKVFGNDDLS